MKKLFDQNRIEDAKRASEDKEYYTNISVLPAFGNISLDLTNPAIRLVVGAWSLIFQFIRRQNLFAVEQKHVHNVRKASL